MALLTAQVVANTGTLLTYGAVAASDTIAPNLGYKYILYVKNGNASPDTCTVVVPGTDQFGQARPDIAVTVTNATEKPIYLQYQDQLADPTTGLITVTHSVTSTVTCALIAIPV